MVTNAQSAMQKLGISTGFGFLSEEAGFDIGEGLIAFRYVADNDANPNGSARDIAGIFNQTRTVLGLMPHPERAVDPAHGGTDGVAMFDGLVAALAR